VLEYFAIWMTKLYLLTIRVPRWIMLLISGSIASFAINLFHGWGGKKAPPKPAARPAVTTGATPAAPAPVADAAAPPASPSKAKQRKGKGKK
jgi:hypothetical protein